MKKRKKKYGKKMYSVREQSHADLYASVPDYREDDISKLIEDAQKDPLILILDRIQDPHNLGACLRTANAAGVDFVIAPHRHTSPITEIVRHIASGAAERIPLIRVKNLVRTLEKLKELGVYLVGTADNVEDSLYDLDYKKPTAFVLGAEGVGIRNLTGKYCDEVVTIPMKGDVDCLNVSVATGVCLFEVVRQRQDRNKNSP